MALRLRARASVTHLIRATCLALVIGLAPAVAFAQSGYVSGEVRDATTHAPLSGVTVHLCSEAGCQTNVTESIGRYWFNALPGTYWAFTSNDIGYTSEIHPDILCQGACWSVDAYHSGGRLRVDATFITTVNFDLDRGGRIEGAITSSATSLPLAGIEVIAYAAFEGWPEQMASTTTNASGTYAIGGLPAGRYFLRTSNPSGFVDEIYDNLPCISCRSTDVVRGTAIDVALASTAAGRDFVLDVGSRITGTVTDAVSTLPQAGVCVYAWERGAFDLAGQDCTDAAGAYEIAGLPSGSYLLWAEAFQSNHIAELYDNVHCPALTCDLTTATLVSVAPGTVASGRNFALEVGGIIRGVLRDVPTSQVLEGASVHVGRRVAGNVVMLDTAATAQGTGEYELRGLPSGTYYVFTDASGHQNEVFDNLPCPTYRCTTADLASTGAPIAVTAGAVTGGIDFDLRGDIPPGPPSRPGASITGSIVTLSWEPSHYGGQVTSFILEAGLTPGTTTVSIPTVEPRYIAMGVGPGVYYLRVKALNAFGTSAASEESQVVVTAAAPASLPGAPQSLHGWMSGSRLTLTWEAPYQGASLTGYIVEAGTGPGWTNVAAFGLNARAFTYLPVPAALYFVRVRAMNASGVGPPSSEVLINSGDVPAPPAGPWLDPPIVSGTTVTLTWETPEGIPATSYLVHAGSASGLSNLAQVNTGSAATTVTFGGVPPGIYYVRVHGVNAAGAGLALNEVIVVVR